MPTKNITIQSSRVTTEGDELYYEVRGQGTPLLLIAGGGGDGRWYSIVADLLADEYKVITYDRRANGRSTKNDPQNFEISQQSRDAAAVIHAAGEESAFVFGNSSGAVIALDMAKTQPQTVRAVVVHEPPLARIHPKAHQWQRFFAGVNWMAYGMDPLIANLAFVIGVGLPLLKFASATKSVESYIEKNYDSSEKPQNDPEFFVKQELAPVVNYFPDVEAIKKNGVRVILAAGKMSVDKKKFYAQTAPVLAAMLGCEMVTFPGHHVSFMDMPEEWAAALRDVLHKA